VNRKLKGGKKKAVGKGFGSHQTGRESEDKSKKSENPRKQKIIPSFISKFEERKEG